MKRIAFPFVEFSRMSFLLGALCCALLPACATTYSAKPISATVIDSTTGQPVDGAVVVINWEMEYIHREGGEHRGRAGFKLLETITDRNGTFSFPAWGPEALPSVEGRPYLSPMVPGFVIFKSGYLIRRTGNPYESYYLDDPNYSGEAVRDSVWNGKSIKLDRAPSDLSEYARRLGTFHDFRGATNCPWKETPRLYAALLEERSRFDALGIRNSLPRLDSLELHFANQRCGSARTFFQEYLR